MSEDSGEYVCTAIDEPEVRSAVVRLTVEALCMCTACVIDVVFISTVYLFLQSARCLCKSPAAESQFNFINHLIQSTGRVKKLPANPP